MRESNTHWIGWNPASNSEGGESFVVGEVQGRRGPLTRRGLCASGGRENPASDSEGGKGFGFTHRERQSRDGNALYSVRLRRREKRLRQRLGQHFLELARWIGPGGPSAWGGKGRTRLVSDVLAATRERVCRIYKLGVLDNPS